MNRSWPSSLLALGIVACAPAPTGVKSMPSLPALQTPAPDLYAAGRLQPEQIEPLAAGGIHHVIDLTLDAETPDFDEAAAVRASGMRYDNLPLRGADDLTLANVQAFDRLLDSAARPVLVHCGSGNRVGAMAALRAAWVQGKSLDEAIAEGRRWGLAGLEPAVREKLRQEDRASGD